MRTLDAANSIRAADVRILAECKRLIHGILPDAAVIIYGSVARGTPGPESDYDILVLTEGALSSADEDRVREVVFDWELEREIVVSLLFHSKEEWDTPLHRGMPFHEEVEREGVIL